MIRKKVLIIGGEGHGTCITSCINDNIKHDPLYQYEVAGFVNDYQKQICNYPVLGGTNDIKRLSDEGYYFAWGINLIAKNPLTFQTFQKMNVPLTKLVTIVHFSAFIGEDVELSPGILVMPHAYIAARTKLGTGTMVKANVCIGHDVECGSLCHFAMGSIVGSLSKIGICSHVAIGATLLDKGTMGSFSILGANSLATHPIGDYEIHVGSPARFFKKIEKNAIYTC